MRQNTGVNETGKDEDETHLTNKPTNTKTTVTGDHGREDRRSQGGL